MKKNALFVIVISFSLFACKKEDKPFIYPSPTPPKNEKNENSIIPADADAALMANHIVTKEGNDTILKGSAVALFFKNKTDIVSVGKVSINSHELSINSEQAYYFVPELSDSVGIDYSFKIDWQVEGKNSFPRFNYNNSNSMPSIGDLICIDSIAKNTDFTLNVSSISNADSILFGIGNLTHIIAGNQTSYTFKAQEINFAEFDEELYIYVIPYNLNLQKISDKNIYFINMISSSGKFIKVVQ